MQEQRAEVVAGGEEERPVAGGGEYLHALLRVPRPQAGECPAPGRRRAPRTAWVFELRDVVGRLLERDPRHRMGAAEIKRHPFFAGVDWALIRCVAPPVVPDKESPAGVDRKAAKLGSWSSMGSNCSSKKRKSSSFNGRRSNCEERQGVFRKLMSWSQESRPSKIKTTVNKVKMTA